MKSKKIKLSTVLISVAYISVSIFSNTRNDIMSSIVLGPKSLGSCQLLGNKTANASNYVILLDAF